MKLRLVVLLGLFFGVVGWSQVGATPILQEVDIDEIARAVVKIDVYRDDRQIASGSGTLVTATGRIFTNAHVVAGGVLGGRFEILMLEDVNELPVSRYNARLVVLFASVDFAILQIDSTLDGDPIDADSLDLPFVPISPEVVRRGEQITIFGYPGIGNGYLVVTFGAITTVQNGKLNGVSVPALYQTNAEIAPGNSGGLAVNSRGEMIAIPSLVNVDGRTAGRLGGLLPIGVATVFENNHGSELELANQTTVQPITGGTDVDCGDGTNIEDGLDILVYKMRSGYTYTVTIIGINGFEPVLGIITEYGNASCVMSAVTDTGGFSYSLPSTGQNTAVEYVVQHAFSQNTGYQMADMHLIIGGKDGTFGEFLVILEGLAYTEFDGNGDPIIVTLNPRVMNSDIPMTVYMMGIVAQLDPYMYIILDGLVAGACDNAGVALTCPNSQTLVGSYLPRTSGTRLQGDALDSMMTLNFSLLAHSIRQTTFPATFYMSSSNFASYGHYLFALHASSR